VSVVAAVADDQNLVRLAPRIQVLYNPLQRALDAARLVVGWDNDRQAREAIRHRTPPAGAASNACTGLRAEQAEPRQLQLRAAVDVRFQRLHHNSCAFAQREARDAHPDGGQGNRAHAVRLCQAQTVRDATANRFGGRLAADAHAGGVNHILGGQVPRACNRRLADLNRSVAVALGLDGRTAFAGNRARHPAAQHEVVIGGVHNRVHRLLRDVRLQHLDAHAVVGNRRHRQGLYPLQGGILTALRGGNPASPRKKNYRGGT
jgi:hypothetical protein